MTYRCTLLAWIGAFLALPCFAQKVSTDPNELRYAAVVSRHGVRSSLGKVAQLNAYSTGVWPDWPVPPGYLTPHGFKLMELFGAYDRSLFSGEGLLAATGCGDAGKVTIYADSDQRTRETGKALAQGFLPGCDVAVQGRDEGTNDPLFHPVEEPGAHGDPKLAVAAIAGRIGGDPANLTAIYRTRLELLDHILATCGSGRQGKRTSLFDVPTSLGPGDGDHIAELKGPLTVGSTLAENLLLEYTEGFDAAKVGWGCVKRPELELLLDLHTGATDVTQRTAPVARAQASNLLDHVVRSLEQGAAAKPVAGAIGKAGDKALFLVGHDTNLENIAGLLNLDWIADGRRDDTPPGSALVFELWRNRATGEDSVRLYYTAQTLDEMREATPLDAAHPPVWTQLFVRGCSRSDLSCTLKEFTRVVEGAIDPGAVVR